MTEASRISWKHNKKGLLLFWFSDPYSQGGTGLVLSMDKAVRPEDLSTRCKKKKQAPASNLQ